MARETITDHADRSIARLPGFEQEGSNWGKLLRALSSPAQDLETALIQLLDERALSTSVGVQLDGIGELLDEVRITGESDVSYRAKLQGKAAQLAKSGEIETLISAYLLIWQPNSVLLVELQPATVELTAIVDSDNSTAEFDTSAIASMNDTIAAGVGTILQVCEEPCFLWGTAADADASGDLPPSISGFGGIVDLVVDGTITYVAAGAADTDIGATTGTVSPVPPAGHAAEDILLIFVSGRGNGYVFVPPPEWTEVFQFDHSTGAAPNTIAMFAKRANSASEPTPDIDWTGGVVNGDVIIQMSAFRPSADSTIVAIQTGPESDNANTETDIGPITAPTDYIETADLLVVCGHRADDWTGVATLSGDGETWAEIGEPVSVLGDDAGMVWGYSILTGTPPVITAKTFSVTGGAAAYGMGIMVSFRVSKGDIASGDGGGNFARVLQ